MAAMGSVHALTDQSLIRPRLGLEIEMVVADARTGASALVSHYFDRLTKIKQAQGVTPEPMVLQDRCVGIRTPQADCGLDNGYNLLETALAPVDGGAGGLDRLAVLAHQELADTLEALQPDGLTVLNASQHPACQRNQTWYQQACVPRPIYKELVNYRGWVHHEGIDAKAQNGANTSVPVHQGVQALNIMIALSAASIALFANSPLESGKLTGHQENRLTLWPRVFEPANFPGDALLARYPERPFHDLGDYFRWMFQPGTVTRALPMAPGGDYKWGPTVIPDHDPSLYEFLHAPRWSGRCVDTGALMLLRPHALHFQHSQIAQFLDARWRYSLQELPELPELLQAWQQEGGLEELFARCGISGYVEGRAPGAGFVDARLLQDAGAAVARSVLIAPIALQQGLLANAEQALALMRERGWEHLGTLRDHAITHGVAHAQIRELCADVLDIARGGLSPEDRHWLEYADYVLQSGRTGAARMLDTWNSVPDDAIAQRLERVVRYHSALHPNSYAHLA